MRLLLVHPPGASRLEVGGWKSEDVNDVGNLFNKKIAEEMHDPRLGQEFMPKGQTTFFHFLF